MKMLDINEVLRHLPHRYPFLLIDRVLDYTEGTSLTALKNVTINEPYFCGHFPQRPVMPGVLMLEALAQATGVLVYASVGSVPTGDELYYFAAIDNARFKRIVEPGDQLILQVEILKVRRDLVKVHGVASVNGETACSADLMCIRKGGQSDSSNSDN